MLDVTIVAVSKIKTDYFRQAELEYIKRLKPYLNLKIKEIKAESFSSHNKEKVKKIEEEKLIKTLSQQDGNIFLLSERGDLFTSEQFSQEINKYDGQKLVLVIAGSLGFGPNIVKKYPKISLSKLTFTHEMARIILLEQIYRAITIEKGKNYHY